MSARSLARRLQVDSPDLACTVHCLAGSLIFVLLTLSTSCGGTSDSAEMSQAEWLSEAAALHDPLFAGEEQTTTAVVARQKRFLSRLSAMPVQQQLTELTAGLQPFASYEQIVLSLADWPPLWQDTTFLQDRLTALEARARELTPDRLATWETALQAIGGTGATRFGNVMDLLEVTQLFPVQGYHDSLATLLRARLGTIPVDTIQALAKTLGRSQGRAALAVASGDFAFTGARFDAAAYGAAHLALRRSLGSR